MARIGIRLRRSGLRSRFGGVGGYGGQVDPGYRFIGDQTKTHLQETSRANLSCCAIGDFRPAFSANAVDGLHLMDWPSVPHGSWSSM
jgi:hypothetical protein